MAPPGTGIPVWFHQCYITISCVNLCLLQVLRLLLAKGADVNACNHSEGLTALHLAAVSGSAEVVHALRAYGANPTLRDRNGHTAAELACIFGRDALAAVLPPPPSKEVSLSTVPRSLRLRTVGNLKYHRWAVSNSKQALPDKLPLNVIQAAVESHQGLQAPLSSIGHESRVKA